MNIGKIVLTSSLLICLMFGFSMQSNAQNRTIKKLSEGWNFTFIDEEVDYLNINDNSWREVKIPHTWNNKDIQSGKKVRYGTGWYKKELNTDGFSSDKQYFLRFEGVGQYAELYINNRYVGEHLGGYSAFVFNISKFLVRDTLNTILVKVNNELNDSYPKDNFLFGIYGGIYRDVSLIETANIHIALSDYASSGVFVQQEEVSGKSALLKITTEIKNETTEKKTVTIVNRLFSKDSKMVTESIEGRLIYPGGLTPLTFSMKINNPHLWNGRKDPYLYRLETEIVQDGKIIDSISQSIGIRFFSIDPEKGFILNGKPYRLYGVCRHQEWEDMGNALLPEHHRKDMELIKELGATSIRLAHYQQAEYIYALADSIGFLVWAEIPFVNGYKENADGNAKQQLIELIKQNYNHPSIFVWGLHNEVVKGGKSQRPSNLTMELHNLAKTIDKDRFTVSVSNIWWVYDHGIHYKAELQGFNQYTGWYGGKPAELKNWIDNFHKAKPDIRFSISEYGAGGNIAQQSDNITTPPNPTGQFFPEGYQTYYHEMTYSAIEDSPFIWASYIWNMFDFSVPEWNRGGIKGRNHKGLVTYDRKTRKDAFYWYKANWSDENVLYLTGRRNNKTNNKIHEFTAYCNFGTPELFVNGKSYGEMLQGVNSVHFTIKNVPLKTGENIIEVKAADNSQILNDKFVLEYEGGSGVK